MRKRILKSLALATTLVMTFASMSLTAFAGDDITLDDAGSPFVKTFDPGDAGEYKYMGYVYCFEAGPEYKYLQFTYTGDATAFEQLRLEFVVNSDPSEEIKLPVTWFAENEEGTFVTTDGGLIPAPSSSPQTVTIDLAASGIDLSTGIRAFHVHDTPGQGTFTITDARLITDLPNGEVSKAEPAETKKASGNNGASEDKKDDKNSGSGSTEVTTASGPQMGDTTGGGSVAAPGTGAPIYPIAIAIGGIAVAGVAFVGSKKVFSENK